MTLIRNSRVETNFPEPITDLGLAKVMGGSGTDVSWPGFRLTSIDQAYLQKHPLPPSTRFELSPQYFPEVRQPFSFMAGGNSPNDFSLQVDTRQGNNLLKVTMGAGSTPLGPNAGGSFGFGRAF